MNREEWFRYIEANRPQIERDFAEAQGLIRAGDADALADWLLAKTRDSKLQLAAEDALGLLDDTES